MGHIETSHGHTSVNESDNVGNLGRCRPTIDLKQPVSYIKLAKQKRKNKQVPFVLEQFTLYTVWSLFSFV